MLPEFKADYTGDIIGWLTATGTWAGPSVAIFLIVGGLYYLLWGRHHYTGPILMGSEDEMKRLESGGGEGLDLPRARRHGEGAGGATRAATRLSNR